MPELKLLTRAEPEESIEGWTVADGHWDAANGVGVIVIVSPAMRAQLEQGLDRVPFIRVVDMATHCFDVVFRRQIAAAMAKR